MLDLHIEQCKLSNVNRYIYIYIEIILYYRILLNGFMIFNICTI